MTSQAIQPLTPEAAMLEKLSSALGTELAFTEVGVNPGPFGANAAGDTAYTGHDVPGFTIPAVGKLARPAMLELHFTGLQVGNTLNPAITFRVINADGTGSTWVERMIYYGSPASVGFAQQPITIRKRLPAGTTVPALKVQWKLSVQGTNLWGSASPPDGSYGWLALIGQ